MLDEKTKLMLEVANQLTTEDIEMIKSTLRTVPNEVVVAEVAPKRDMPVSRATPLTSPSRSTSGATARGEYERLRPRESKVSTACIGSERAKHEWWPVGTELVGRMRDQVFTAEVVENPSVKSNRSLRIVSGPAHGAICITPTRAAIEATETYRQENNLGRAGGVTNGWTFWKPKATTA